MLPPAVMWIDPGGMTGIATLLSEPSLPGFTDLAHSYPRFAATELTFENACAAIEGMCGMYAGHLAVGWERFDIGPDTHKKTREGVYDALHMIGVCRYVVPRWGCRVLTPAAPADRLIATMDDLKRLGWWVPGKDDAQSAAQHMLAWLIRTGELSPAQREALYSKKQP